ncbi:MAG TPA: tRNA (adenosine(37)-N6)-dimethylallyltransferase MiaA [Bryobacteraceae bacterium]|nr:tRNA (adenosine(37)-N6)-dimethylallyltransferase MiaA [Bryobacteraceae bacterium]
MSEPLLVVLLGPTASGKTSLSLRLAERLQGEIVSCDSVAVYREFEIGTAKPSREDRQRIHHHMIDVVEPTGLVTAGDYSRMARAAIQQIAAHGRVPMVVGGTGLYLRALLEGLFAGPRRSEELRRRLRSRAEERGPEHLHRILRRLDPSAAAGIHANDVPKVIRALEICLSARKPMTEIWRQGRDPLRGFRILRLGLNPDRELLYHRINQRARGMFSLGLIEETRDLLARYGAAARPLNSLGYKQAAQYLAGELTLDQAIAAAQQGHRNYAKRQMTWFRREPDVRWLQGFGSDEKVQRECFNLIDAECRAGEHAH